MLLFLSVKGSSFVGLDFRDFDIFYSDFLTIWRNEFTEELLKEFYELLGTKYSEDRRWQSARERYNRPNDKGE